MKRKITKDDLVRTVALELKDRLTADAFYAAHFFRRVKQLQAEVGEDGSLTDPTLMFELLLEVVGDHEAEVRRVVGADVESVFGFLSEVLAYSDDAGEGDSLGE